MYVTEWVTPPSDIVEAFAWRATEDVEDRTPSKDAKGQLVTRHGAVRQVWSAVLYDTFERFRQASTAQAFRSLFTTMLSHPADDVHGDISHDQCTWVRDLRGEGESFTVIYNHTGYPLDMLIRHATGQCQCPTSTPSQEAGNEPWREEFVLERMLDGHGYLQTELATMFDCQPDDVADAVESHGLD